MAHVIDGPNHKFAMRLLEARRDAKMTQEDLANKLGIDVRNISQYENGRQFPRKGMVTKIAAALQVDATVLAKGHTQEMLDYLDKEQEKMPKVATQVSMLHVKEWDKISFGGTLTYNKEPRYGNESAELSAFIPFAEPLFGRHAAVRYPGTVPANPAYPAGCILIYGPAPHMPNRIPSGADVIFRLGGMASEAGLRRLVREPGMETALLVPLDATAPFDPIPFDPLDVEVIGIVVQRVIDSSTSRI